MSMDEAMERAVKEAMADRFCGLCRGSGCHHCDSTGKSPLWRILETVVPKTENRAVIRKVGRQEKLCYCGIEYSMAVKRSDLRIEYTVEFQFGVVSIALHRLDPPKEAEDMFTAILESRK